MAKPSPGLRCKTPLAAFLAAQKRRRHREEALLQGLSGLLGDSQQPAQQGATEGGEASARAAGSATEEETSPEEELILQGLGALFGTTKDEPADENEENE